MKNDLRLMHVHTHLPRRQLCPLLRILGTSVKSDQNGFSQSGIHFHRILRIGFVHPSTFDFKGRTSIRIYLLHILCCQFSKSTEFRQFCITIPLISNRRTDSRDAEYPLQCRDDLFKIKPSRFHVNASRNPRDMEVTLTIREHLFHSGNKGLFKIIPVFSL